VALATIVGGSPAPVAAVTSGDVAGMILASLNADRVGRGLVGYRTWGALTALATERAQRMADATTLSHTAAGGNVGNALDTRSIDWLGYGEIIGMSGWPFGREAADNLYSMWKNSAVHRGIMFSAGYNYIGIGIAQAADGSTWASAVMTESLDHTQPTARTVSLTRRGNDLRFTWSGSDPRLQTHTAGLRSFDVQFRRDDRRWRTIRDNTTRTSVKRNDRVRGHWYHFRVQAKDGRGNLSAWTVEARIWVP
jgi:hypothetical protein